jgi:hypothetical protein
LPRHICARGAIGLPIPEHLGYHPVRYQDRVSSEPSLPFHITQLFDVHAGTSEHRHSHPNTIESARVELTSSYGSGSDDVIGMSGLPSNELQNYLRFLLTKKLEKNEKYQILQNRFHSSAVAAMSVVLEELTTHLIETWRENIRHTIQTRGESEEEEEEEEERETEEKEDRANSTTARARATDCLTSQLHSLLPQSLTDLLLSMGGMLPGPLEYSNKLFERFAKLQIQGADLQSRPLQDTLILLQNRLEILFGRKLSNEQKDFLCYLLQEEKLKQIIQKKDSQERLHSLSQENYPLKRHPVKGGYRRK